MSIGLTFSQRFKVYEFLKLIGKEIEEKRMRTHHVATKATDSLGFRVTKNHIRGLAKEAGIKFSVAPAPGEKRGAAQPGRVASANAMKRDQILAKYIIELSTQLGVNLPQEICDIAKLNTTYRGCA
jgi:hypothetical protein